jgi:hypothetical protein
MIVIEGRYGIHADAGFCQSTGDGCQKTCRFKRGMNGQRDHSRGKLIGEPCSFGFLAPYDESRSFTFVEDVHRPECGGNFLVFRHAAKNENAFMQLGRHILQQRRQIAFARHGRMLFQQAARISHRAARLRVRWLIWAMGCWAISLRRLR